MIRKLRKRTFEIIEGGDDPRARAFQLSIMTLISFNVVAVVLETVESLSVRYETFFYIFELFSVIVFTGEYLLRTWSCV
jgi:voltage-gated potassium channel